MKNKSKYLLIAITFLTIGCSNVDHGKVISGIETKEKINNINEVVSSEDFVEPEDFVISTYFKIVSKNVTLMEYKTLLEITDNYIHARNEGDFDGNFSSEYNDVIVYADDNYIYYVEESNVGGNNEKTYTVYESSDAKNNNFDSLTNNFGSLKTNFLSALNDLSKSIISYADILMDTDKYLEDNDADMSNSRVKIEAKSKDDSHLYLTSDIVLTIHMNNASSITSEKSIIEIDNYLPILLDSSIEVKTITNGVEQSQKVVTKIECEYEFDPHYPDLNEYTLKS